MGTITYNTYRDDWAAPNGWNISSQVVTLCSNATNQVIEFVGCIGQVFKLISRTDPNLIEQRVDISSITISPYELNGHKVIKPFDISIECLANGDFLAKFDEAAITIASDSRDDAINEIKEVIITLFGIYKGSSLGPEPARQLEVLEKYIE